MSRIGLFLCECGPNIAEAIDLDKIAEFINKENKVAGIERHRLLCSEEGKKFLAESIKQNQFDHIVIAACSPKQHESTFMQVLSQTGLNPYLLQLVNIREQCAWTTPDKEAATKKALRLIRAAINRVRFHSELQEKEIEATPDVVVIGAGITGIEAALSLAQQERSVYLIDKDKLGGMLKNLQKLVPGMIDAQKFLQEKIAAVNSQPQIRVFEDSQVKEILGFFGNFIVTIVNKEKEINLKAGSVVLGIGAQEFVPEGMDQFGYGLKNVYTALQFEKEGLTKIPNESKTLAIIHCVGREKLGYCSKFCCVNSMKLARLIKEKRPDIKVIQFYQELCLPGKEYDKFYRETREKGIEFIRFDKIGVGKNGNQLELKYGSGDGTEKHLDVDTVVLSTGIIPSSETKDFAQMLNIAVDDYGFFKEEHIKLGSVSTLTDGIFIAGTCQGPKCITESILQAKAAAGRILSALIPGRKLPIEAKVSEISDSLCMGCGICVQVCAYGAVSIDERKHISVVNEVLCRGCGNCAASCPSGAASHRHFTNQQLYYEAREILR